MFSSTTIGVGDGMHTGKLFLVKVHFYQRYQGICYFFQHVLEKFLNWVHVYTLDTNTEVATSFL